MHTSKGQNKFVFRAVLLFAGVLFLAYLPISSFLFFIKNDAFTNYFPPKFFMSESIHAGYLPLWNPYINFGIPQYGDMNAGYWSPITWLIASTIGYTAYTLTLETLLYIFIGGLGMHKLSGLWIAQKNVRLIAGLAFMCCGYHVAHLQHFNWLSGSAFLPWCFWSYLQFLGKRTITNTLITVLLFYLFIASAHPGLVIGSFYFFTAILLFIFFKNERQQPLKNRLLELGASHLIFLLVLIPLAAGIIAGYTDIIPHFVRGEKPDIESSLPHSSNLKTWISILLPFSTVKNHAFFDTELTLRNSYFSLTLLLLFITALLAKKNRWQKFLLLVGFAFALLSSGGWAKIFAHHYLPYLGYVRLNGEFRIFAIIAFIIVASIELEKFTKKQSPENFKYLKSSTYFIFIILITSFCWALYKIGIGRDSIVFNFHEITSISGFPGKAKYIVDAISFYDTIVIQGSFQVLLLGLIYKSIKSKNTRLLLCWLMIDIIVSSLFNVPYTGAGKTSVAHLQSVINHSPKGIPIPALHPILNNDTIPASDNALLGNWSMYNKQPGTIKEMPYPIQLNNMRAFFDSNSSKDSNHYFHKPFLFVMRGNAKVTILHYSPNKIEVKVITDTASKLVIQQNNYPYWKYQVNGEMHDVTPEGINFMAVPLKKGVNEVLLAFNPLFIKAGLYVSAFFFLLYFIILIVYKTKSPAKE